MTPPSRRYLPSPLACVTLEKITEQFGGNIEFEKESAIHRYALPAHASLELRNFFAGEAEATFPAEFMARVPGGRVFGSGNVLSPDGALIARDVSPDFGKPFAEHWLLTYPKIPEPKLVPGRTAVVASTLGDGYAHWLLEEFPRWLRTDLSSCDAVIAHHANAFTREALAGLRFSGKLIEAERGAHFACEQLLVPCFSGLAGFPAPETAAKLNAWVDARLPKVDGVHERIFLSRAKSRRRRVSNETELWAQLETRGFVRLSLEDLSWPEQIAAFRRAKVVVAPHGAGLANAIFSAPGTRVVEFFHRDFVDGLYWRLSSLRNLDYRPVVAESDQPLRHLLAANREDFAADISKVLAAVFD